MVAINILSIFNICSSCECD